MKKFLLPIILLIAGIGFIAYPFFLPSGDIDLKIQPATVIMPAAYKVYSNPDILGGRYNLFKAVVKNSTSSEIKNLKVQFRVPGLIPDWTDVPAATNLLPGQTAVATCYPVFPQSITERNTTSKEKTEIKITYGNKGNPTERDESFPFDVTSVNDIVFTNMADQDKAYAGDFGENRVLYACMVSSEDPIIKHYAQAVQQKILCGESGAGVGESGEVTDQSIKEKVRVMQGVYNATLLSHMVYSETQSGVSKFGDNTSSTEHIRLPREVVSGNTGLCIELALLHASIYKAAGLNPVIFLVPGHAYPGIKVGNQYIPIESTGIGGVGLGGIMSADQALKKGLEELKTFYEESSKGNPQYQLLDIDQLYSQGFKDMELKPDPTLADETDKILQTWPTCLISALNQPARAAAYASRPRPKPRTRSTEYTTSNWQRGAINTISFSYPGSWPVYPHPVAQIPFLIAAAISPDKTAQVETYHVAAQNPEQAIYYIKMAVNRMGETVQYSETGSENNLTRFNGTTYNNGITLTWVGYFRNGYGGVDGVIVGTTGGGNRAVLNEIVNSIR
ncbi:MAG: hypothetical protein JO080_13105 [Mucilaginibacter sp.]|nr:hypothetical protein [Mucilaginibacter sp.]